MAERSRRLSLRYSLLAESCLAQIWRWNAEHYNATHATEFLEFLKGRTSRLQSDYLRGRPIPTRPSYRYLTLKKRARGSGYVVVYQVLETEIHVFYYFHTSQDWLQQLESILAGE